MLTRFEKLSIFCFIIESYSSLNDLPFIPVKRDPLIQDVLLLLKLLMTAFHNVIITELLNAILLYCYCIVVLFLSR